MQDQCRQGGYDTSKSEFYDLQIRSSSFITTDTLTLQYAEGSHQNVKLIYYIQVQPLYYNDHMFFAEVSNFRTNYFQGRYWFYIHSPPPPFDNPIKYHISPFFSWHEQKERGWHYLVLLHVKFFWRPGHQMADPRNLHSPHLSLAETTISHFDMQLRWWIFAMSNSYEQ